MVASLSSFPIVCSISISLTVLTSNIALPLRAGDSMQPISTTSIRWAKFWFVFPTILGLAALATTIANHATVVEANGISIYGPEMHFRDWALVFLTATN